MGRIDFEQFNDEELMGIVSNNISLFLAPFKKSSKQYSRYISMLGRMIPSSTIVRKNLPAIAVQLYNRRDQNFVKAMELAATGEKETLPSDIGKAIGKADLTEETLKERNIEETLADLAEYVQRTKDSLNPELLWTQLKLVGIHVSDDLKKTYNKKLIFDELEMEKNVIDNTEKAFLEDIDNNYNEELQNLEQRVNIANDPEIKKDKKTTGNNVNEEELKTKEISKKNDLETESQKPTNLFKNEPVQKDIKYAKWGEKDMGVYVGKIQNYGNFYNIAPIGELKNHGFYPFSEYEIDKLLPNSIKRNINLYYSFSNENQRNFMSSFFHDGQNMLIEFNEDDLEENRDSFGVINQTGYKIPGIDSYRSGIVKPLYEDGFYALKTLDVLDDDIDTSKIVRINYSGIYNGEKILLNMGNGFYAGPFEVKSRPTVGDYYIQPRGKGNSYLISGFSSDDIGKVVIEPNWDVYHDNYPEIVYYLKDGATPKYKDVITDEILLASVKDSLNNIDSENDVATILQNFKDSVISSAEIPEEIVIKRSERLKEILHSDYLVKENINFVSDAIYSFLLTDKNSERSDAIINSILEKHPEIFDKLQSTRILKDRGDSLRQEIEQLELQRKELKEENQTIRDEAEKHQEEILAERIAEVQEMMDKAGIGKDIQLLKNEKNALKEEVDYLEIHKSHLVNDTKNLESQFMEMVSRSADKIAGITFDGYMTSKMLQSAANWEQAEKERSFGEIVANINNIETSAKTSEEVIEYLISKVQIVRPQYDKNTIINLAICSIQGFLTVLSGAPGCGKTSMCNILSKVLGLNKFDKVVNTAGKINSVNRYIPVSVERGWTSKRDFIGYYNPLTKAFEESNREVFDGLRILDIEAREKVSRFPFFILLDEANLSPMEYYWADFMNVCDDQADNNSINLGENNIYEVPETLHFLATINNDHTTETLSPRLIDRAWVVTLPKVNVIQYGKEINENEIELLTWEDLKKTFISQEADMPILEPEIQKIYDDVRKLLNEVEVIISPRTDIAIRKYCEVASRLMESDEYGNSASVVALDYAISQKILPKLSGNGDEFAEWIGKFKNVCASGNLSRSADILEDMIKRGNKRMKYYQFFS